MSLKEQIKTEALRLGFSLAGVTNPDPPPHFPEYEAWLAAGRHGQMNYLATERARQRRYDPRQILPECLSILILGIRYPSPKKEILRSAQDDIAFAQDDNLSEALSYHSERSVLRSSKPESPRGRVASYAWGVDYHELLAGRLKALATFIEAQEGHPVSYRWYTDTGPILERDLAQRAGLGWIGKNTCLIHPRHGSYFLLAEMLLGLELEPDPPFLPDFCGSCRRCLEACPTACILPDRTIDARRCISYLTIELKSSIPEDLRPKMGEWIFGCDICQEVCPWNQRFADPAGEWEHRAALAFAPQLVVAYPNLIQELTLTPQEFSRKFKGSPVKRARRGGYLRNATVALGNAFAGTPNPTATLALGKALREDPEPLVRAHAAWSLGRMGGGPARLVLQESATREGNPSVLAEIQAALRQFEEPDSSFPG